MMPNMRQALKGLGRRLSYQVIKQQVVDREAVQTSTKVMRASVVLTPMKPQAIAIKPEGQRTWKWWSGISATKLEVGWMLKPDGDGKRVYEVMEVADWSQARIYSYEFAEAPR